MREYDELLNSGNAAQVEKLKMNKHKRGFENIDIGYAEKRLNEECRELYLEIYGRIDGEFKTEKVRHEAADIANFAHMIIFKCDQLLKEELDKSEEQQ